ncbi:MAG TPA: hypothetical protein PK509_18595 [Catalimonadaceae bacterium]|nr:hypothetical protein [Catalimonadaceae bacterium]
MKLLYYAFAVLLLSSCSEQGIEDFWLKVQHKAESWKPASIDSKRQTLLGKWISDDGKSFLMFSKTAVCISSGKTCKIKPYEYIDLIDTAFIRISADSNTIVFTYHRLFSNTIVLKNKSSTLKLNRIYPGTGFLNKVKTRVSPFLSRIFPPCEIIDSKINYGFWDGFTHSGTILFNYGSSGFGFESGTYCFGTKSFRYLFGFLSGLLMLSPLLYLFVKEE